MRKDHLQSLYNVMSKSNVDLVYGDRFIYENETPLSIGIYHDFDPYLLLRRNYIDTSDVLVRKSSLLELGGFDERYKKYIDWNMWVRMAKAGMTFLRVQGLSQTTTYILTQRVIVRKTRRSFASLPGIHLIVKL